MKVPLDTRTAFWATLSPSALSRQAPETIANEGNVLLVSAASAWETATKVRTGKLPGAEKLDHDYLEAMEEGSYTQPAIDTASALRAGRLAAEHRAPLDRMIAAQAPALDVAVLSPDPQLDRFCVRRVW